MKEVSCFFHGFCCWLAFSAFRFVDKGKLFQEAMFFTVICKVSIQVQNGHGVLCRLVPCM